MGLYLLKINIAVRAHIFTVEVTGSRVDSNGLPPGKVVPFLDLN